MLALVSITGHYGGNLTHGTTFLGEYAPSFLRALIGAAPRRPRRTSVAAADPYLDVVQPLLEQRCGTCHNDDKREGGFSMGSYDSTARRRRHGPRDRARQPRSERAVSIASSLPPDDEAFMPAEGKTPLTAAQVEILRWWVGAGAPRDTTVGALGVPRTSSRCSPRNSGLTVRHPRPRRRPPAAPPSTRNSSPTLFAAGFLVRQISQSDTGLVVSVSSPGTELGAGALAALKPPPHP